MKVTSILIVLALTCGCVKREETSQSPLKYKEGDVIYLKPDSLRGTVISTDHYSKKYGVKYFDVEGDEESIYIDEFEIYGKIH